MKSTYYTILRYVIAHSKVFMLVFPTLCLVTYLIWPALNTLSAIYSFNSNFYSTYSTFIANPDKTQQELIRNVQSYFNSFDISIDSKNIILVEDFVKQHDVNFELRGCMKNKVVTFLPITFRIPIFGKYIYEWCLVIE